MPLPSTMTPIATNTTNAAVSSVDFTSIPQGYTDLVLVYTGSGTSVNTQGIRVRFNSDTATNYSDTMLRGTGSAAASYRDTTQSFILFVSNNTNTSQMNGIMNIMNYSNTTTYKSCLIRANDPSARIEALVGLWRSTAAITSVNIIPESGTINSGCTFTLYGIKAA